MPNDLAVCILLPVLNEADNVRPLCQRIAAALASRSFTVCFVDDGSRDGTLTILRDLQRNDSRIHVIARQKKRRGSQRGSALYSALRWGLSDPRFGTFVEMDGDLSHRPEELGKGLEMVESGRWDVAVASKYLAESQVTNRPAGRRAVSLFCNLAVRAVISPALRDYSNGYRFYTRAAAEHLQAVRIRHGSPIYLTEVMAIWQAAGLRIGEFPTTYIGRNEGVSKLRKRDLLKAAVAIFDIAVRYRTGFQPAAVTPRPATEPTAVE